MSHTLRASCLLFVLAVLVPAGTSQAGRETCSLVLPDANGNMSHIEVIGWSHEVVSPRDAASGLPTGKRQHKPFVVTKPVDKATPFLFDAIANDHTLAEVRFHCERPPAAGAEVQHYTVTLENASIATIRTQQVGTRAQNMQHPPREHVAFTYQRIVHTWRSPRR